MAGDGASEGHGGAALLGLSGGASVGRRRRRIVVGGASVAPSDARGVGSGVGGSTSAGLWWGRCRGGGRWQRNPGLAVAS